MSTEGMQHYKITYSRWVKCQITSSPNTFFDPSMSFYLERYVKNPFNHILIFPNIWKPCLITYARMAHFLSLRKAGYVLWQLVQIPAY